MIKKLVFFFLVLFVIGCSEPPEPEHDFKEGDCVVIKLTGEEGMATMTFQSYLYVRLPYGKRLIGEGVFHSGTVLNAPYPEIRFWHYELEHCG